MNKNTHITNSFEETKSLGRKIAKDLKKGDFLAFYGDLGSGKTTFTQGLAEGLGIKRRITSPTFIIVRKYNLLESNFYHIDLYRTQTKEDILGLGIDSLIKDKENIIALEWAEKISDFLPEKRIEINFNYLDENKREIVITKYE